MAIVGRTMSRRGPCRGVPWKRRGVHLSGVTTKDVPKMERCVKAGCSPRTSTASVPMSIMGTKTTQARRATAKAARCRWNWHTSTSRAPMRVSSSSGRLHRKSTMPGSSSGAVTPAKVHSAASRRSSLAVLAPQANGVTTRSLMRQRSPGLHTSTG